VLRIYAPAATTEIWVQNGAQTATATLVHTAVFPFRQPWGRRDHAGAW